MPHLKVGRVSSRDASTARAVVAFGADDAMASWTLPVMQSRSGDDRSYWMPDVGEFVVCVLDEHAEFGVVLGGIYSAADAPPIASLDTLHVAFKDGTTIAYDRAAHVLSIVLAAAGAINLSAKDVTINVPGDGSISLGAAGDQLVTKAWVDERFASHVHVSNGSPPVEVAGSPTWTTQRTTAT